MCYSEEKGVHLLLLLIGTEEVDDFLSTSLPKWAIKMRGLQCCHEMIIIVIAIMHTLRDTLKQQW